MLGLIEKQTDSSIFIGFLLKLVHYLTDKEQKISWHSFLRHGVVAVVVVIV